MCSGPPPEVDPEVITEIEWKYDTLIVDSIVYVPKWKTKIINTTDTFFTPADTIKIVENYLTKYFYQDTLNLDTLGYVVVNDTIYKNQIYTRNINYSLTIPTLQITNTIYKNKTEWYFGLGVAGRTSQLNYIGGELLLRTKKSQIYKLGLGVNQDFNPVISGGMYWRLGKN